MQKSIVSRHVTVRQGAHLPHWTFSGATYAVCFRLADSLPIAVMAEWQRERMALLTEVCVSNRELTPAQREHLDELFSSKVEHFLNAGHGACWLRQPEIAEVVIGAFRHFDGERYRLAAWCIMSNHVHVVVQPLGTSDLPSILKTWKGFSATAANRLLKRNGEFWQAEYYDHLVRDDDDLAHSIRYVVENPANAGLGAWPWVWVADEGKALLARVSAKQT